MEIEYMKEFIVLANCLGFSRAAEEIFISQSTLSRHIASIEKEIGFALIRRNTHSVELTPAGEVAMERFRSITAQYDTLLRDLESLQSGYQGKLRLGILHFATERYMTPIIKDFLKAYPAVDLRLFIFDSYEMCDAILNGLIDAGLVVSAGELESNLLDYHLVCQEKVYLAMSNEHRLASKESISVEDLKDETVVLSKHDLDYNNYIEAIIKRFGIEFKKYVYSIHLDTLPISLSEYGAVTFLTDHIRDKAHSNMIFRPFNKEISTNVIMRYRKDYTNPTLNLFLQVLDNHI